MHELLIAAAIFVCLAGAALVSQLVSSRLPPHYREEDTSSVVRLAANIFVVSTSLVLGLMLNSAKNTFEAVDRNVHAFATDLIVLDRSLRHYGPEAADVRERLARYVQQAVAGTWRTEGAPVLDDRVAERLLDEAGNALADIRPTDPVRIELWREARANLQEVVKRRWSVIEESEGSIPVPFIFMLVAWLILIFASYGYRAPRNALVASTLLSAALLIASSIYLMLDMAVPFTGPIKISPAPLLRAAEQMRE